jgi:ubiquinone/menaquinone biosynthesis C-methylase UbiE
MFKKIKDKINNRYDLETLVNEDKPVISFLKMFSDKIKNKQKYLEVGSGHGRFMLKIKDAYPNLDVEAIEINRDLSESTNKRGIKTINKDFLNNNFKDQEFDIVHCSHTIEHFGYPKIVEFLDELFRVTKINGFIIIRSPLWHPGFYNDIDHVRPYPPKTIFNYLRNFQQQKKSPYDAIKILDWPRKECWLIDNIMGRALNSLFKLSWIYFKFPSNKQNGYVLILKKIK